MCMCVPACMCVCVCTIYVMLWFCLQGSSSAVVPLQLDASGKVKYDVLARMGQRKDKVQWSSCQSV